MMADFFINVSNNYVEILQLKTELRFRHIKHGLASLFITNPKSCLKAADINLLTYCPFFIH